MNNVTLYAPFQAIDYHEHLLTEIFHFSMSSFKREKKRIQSIMILFWMVHWFWCWVSLKRQYPSREYSAAHEDTGRLYPAGVPSRSFYIDLHWCYLVLVKITLMSPLIMDVIQYNLSKRYFITVSICFWILNDIFNCVCILEVNEFIL